MEGPGEKGGAEEDEGEPCLPRVGGAGPPKPDPEEVDVAESFFLVFCLGSLGRGFD